MPRQVHFFDAPERFVAGTVGQPGERTFFLQAKQGGRVVSVALEKVQVAILAERLGELLDQVGRHGPNFAPLPAAGTGVPDDVAPLDQPIMEEFRVGTMALAWDGEAERVLVEAHAQVPEGAPEPPEPLTDAEEGPDVLRVSIGVDTARAFIARADKVVSAGRPPCPLCGLPLDAEGHICPRQNGFRR